MASFLACDESKQAFNYDRSRITLGRVPDKFFFTKHLRTPSSPSNASLIDFGYHFVLNGTRHSLVQDRVGIHGFVWNGQKHYDFLTGALVREVQKRLTTDAGLSAVKLFPSEKTLVYVSPNAASAETIIVLIHGSGAVRAGMWANSVAINNSLEAGSMLPAIAKAQERGWGVIVINPNVQDKVCSGRNGCIDHTVAAFDKFVVDSKAGKGGQVLMIAHSNGGKCVMGLLKERQEEVIASVAGISFTDAVHYKIGPPFKLEDSVTDFLAQRTVDWVASSEPLDTPLKYACDAEDSKKARQEYATPYRGMGKNDPIPIRSAGHAKHVWTTACALGPAFAHLDAMLRRSSGLMEAIWRRAGRPQDKVDTNASQIRGGLHYN